METSRSFRERTRAGFRIFRNRRFIEAGAIALAAFLPALAAGIATGMLLRYRVLGAWLVPLLAVAGIALAAVLGVRFGRAHRLSHPEFLRHLERRLDLRENQLVNADEMAERSARMEDPLARGLAELAVQAGDEALRNVSFPRLAPALDLRRPALWGGGGVAVLAILFAVSPGAFTGSAGRLVRPGRAELPPALAIRVEPGNTTVERGAAVTVTARLPKPGSGVQLYMRSPGGPWKTLAMDPSGALRFAALIPEVVETTEYAVASGRARSETYRIRVIEPLRASGYRKRVEFPAYTGLAAVEELSADGNLNALVGSRASLTVLPTRPGATGRLLVTGGSPIPLETGGKDELIAVLPVRGPLDYRVELSAKDLPGSHWESEPFRLDAAADRPPSLFQLSPERASKIPPDMQVQLDVECLDDFGLSRLDLVYRRNDGEPKRIQLSRWGGGKEARVLYPWALDGVAAVPGDRIGYHLELTDNDAVTGPKTTVGPECELRFPSLDEMYTEVQEDRSGQMQSAQEALEQQKDLQRNLDRIQSDLKQSKTMRWEQQQQLQDLAAKQQKIAEQIGDLSKSLDSSLDRMQQGSLVTPEMLQKVQQINDMVRDLQSPELRDYLQKLQDALQRLDRNAVNQALEKLQLTQQELERNLDRMLKIVDTYR